MFSQQLNSNRKKNKHWDSVAVLTKKNPFSVHQDYLEKKEELSEEEKLILNILSDPAQTVLASRCLYLGELINRNSFQEKEYQLILNPKTRLYAQRIMALERVAAKDKLTPLEKLELEYLYDDKFRPFAHQIIELYKKQAELRKVKKHLNFKDSRLLQLLTDPNHVTDANGIVAKEMALINQKLQEELSSFFELQALEAELLKKPYRSDDEDYVLALLKGTGRPYAQRIMDLLSKQRNISEDKELKLLQDKWQRPFADKILEIENKLPQDRTKIERNELIFLKDPHLQPFAALYIKLVERDNKERSKRDCQILHLLENHFSATETGRIIRLQNLKKLSNLQLQKLIIAYTKIVARIDCRSDINFYQRYQDPLAPSSDFKLKTQNTEKAITELNSKSTIKPLNAYDNPIPANRETARFDATLSAFKSAAEELSMAEFNQILTISTRDYVNSLPDKASVTPKQIEAMENATRNNPVIIEQINQKCHFLTAALLKIFFDKKIKFTQAALNEIKLILKTQIEKRELTLNDANINTLENKICKNLIRKNNILQAQYASFTSAAEKLEENYLKTGRGKDVYHSSPLLKSSVFSEKSAPLLKQVIQTRSKPLTNALCNVYFELNTEFSQESLDELTDNLNSWIERGELSLGKLDHQSLEIALRDKANKAPASVAGYHIN